MALGSNWERPLGVCSPRRSHAAASESAKSYSPVGARLASGRVCDDRGRSAPVISRTLTDVRLWRLERSPEAAIKDDAEQDCDGRNAHRVLYASESAFGVHYDYSTNMICGHAGLTKRSDVRFLFPCKSKP